MQIPTEWYVHILPGIVVLFSILIPARRLRGKFLDLIKEHAVGSAVAVAICAYLVGFSENVIVLFVIRPLLECIGIMDPPLPHSTNEWVTFYQFAPQALIEAIRTGYQNMLLYRSLLGASIVLCVAICFSLAERTHTLKRLGVLALAILLTYSLYQNWRYTTTGYMQSTPQALKSVSQMQQK